jgi:hypothetical protein
MAQIVITIPDDKVQQVLDILCKIFGYNVEILNDDGDSIPNPQTKSQFVKSIIIDFIKRKIKSYKLNEISLVSDTQANTDTDALGIN